MFNKNGNLNIDKISINSILDILESLQIDCNKTIIMDIETTGFSPKNSIVYLIGTCYFHNNSFHYNMDLCLPNEEKILLEKFILTISKYNYIITFNGNMFDLRFLKERLSFYNLEFDFSKMVSIDLYKLLKKYKNLLGLSSCKLGDFYTYITNKTFDDKDGGLCIPIYKKMLKQLHNPNNGLNTLFEHNFVDLIKTTSIISLLSLQNLTKLSPSYTSHIIKDSKLYINFTLAGFKGKIDISSNSLRIVITNNKGLLISNIVSGYVPMYLSPIKDYVYLISENRAIPKAIGKFLNKTQITKCTKENCYMALHINDPWINEQKELIKLLNYNYKFLIENI